MDTRSAHPTDAFPTPPLNDAAQHPMIDPLTFTHIKDEGNKPFFSAPSEESVRMLPATLPNTTVTSTSFPKSLYNEPRKLPDRDPKQWPLAASSTPASLRRFTVQVDGQTLSFEDKEDGTEPVFSIPFKSRISGIRTPQRGLERKNMDSGRPQSPTHPNSSRTMSPVSISEAAKIADLQQRRKKRQRLDGPATPVGSRSFAHQLRTVETPTSGSGTEDAGPMQEHTFVTPRLLRSQRNNMSKMSETDEPKTIAFEHTTSGSSLQTEDSLTRPMGLGVSATPPIVEGDLEHMGPVEDNLEEVQVHRPVRIETVIAEDTALPSPSLSPTTAAANLTQGRFQLPFVEGDVAADYEIDPTFLLSQNPDASEFNSPQTSTNISQGKAKEPPFQDIRSWLNLYDNAPPELQSYMIFQILRRTTKPTLQLVADIVNPALKIDFLSLLPGELCQEIVGYLDVKSMCRAAQVSRRWRQIIDSNEKAWKSLIQKDGYSLARGEIERAVKEGWGWQYPDGPNNFERDLSRLSPSKIDTESTSATLSVPAASNEITRRRRDVTPTNNPRKRKLNSRHSGSKRRKTKSPSLKTQHPSWFQDLEAAQGPSALANAAVLAVPDPSVGLPSLSNMHLYKSLYHRNHAIRKSWMEENSQPRHFAFQAHGTHVVTCLQFDSDKILTGSDDTKINVFDTESGALRKTLDGHEGGVWALQYDGNLLVSGSTDRSVRVWDIESGHCLQIFQGHTSTVRCLIILKPTKIGEREDGSPIMMPEQPLIITGSRDSSLRVWKLPGPNDPSIFQTVATANDNDNPYFVRVLTGHHHSVRAIAAHGDTLVSGSYDHTVRVWKISTGEVLHRLLGHAQKVYSVVLDHTRNRCISGSMDNLVKVWSLDNGACLFNLEGHTSLVGLLDLNHDRLVSAAADSTLRIWDPETGQCKSTLSAHTGAITCFQHDNQKVVSGSDRTLKMWNIKTGDCVRDLLTGLSGVWQVKFNDRRCVAAVQRDHWTYIEVLDFGAARDVAFRSKLGSRTFVDRSGHEVEDLAQAGNDNANAAPAAGPAVAPPAPAAAP